MVLTSTRIAICARFVDLATMAKVSVLILDEKYHGWYLHCRSPYPRVSVHTFIAPSVTTVCSARIVWYMSI